MSDRTDSPVADEVLRLLTPVVGTAGVELLDVEWTGGTLRVVVDRLFTEDRTAAPPASGEGDGEREGVEDDHRITTDQLGQVNRLISPILDQHDPVPGRYTLEVTSPGVERPLRRPDHFRRAVGEDVVVKLRPVSSGEPEATGPRRVRGRLAAVDLDAITVEAVETDGVAAADPESVIIDLDRIDKARTVFDWGPTPKKPTTGRSAGQKRKPSPHNAKRKKQSKQSNSKKKQRSTSQSDRQSTRTAGRDTDNQSTQQERGQHE